MNARFLVSTIFAALVAINSACGQPVKYEVIVTSDQQAAGMPLGVTYGEFRVPFIDEAGRVTFQCIFSQNNIAVYRVPGGEPPILVRTGDTPAGMGPNNVVSAPFYLDAINRAGDLAIRATLQYLDSDPVPSRTGVWSHSEDSGFVKASLSGVTAPGTNAIMCSTVDSDFNYSISNAGHIVMFSELCGPNPVPANAAGIWVTDENGMNLSLVTRRNGLMPGMPDVRIPSIGTPVVNSEGTVVFRGYLNGPGVTEDNNFTVFAWNETTGLTVVVREGDAVPGFPPTVTFASGVDVRINDLGHTLIWGKIQGPGITDDSDQILISDRGGNGFEHIYREGIQAPGLTGGVKIYEIGDVHFNNRSQIGFFSHVDGPIAVGEDGLYFWSEGGPPGLTKVARTGQQVPGFQKPFILSAFQTYELGGGYGPKPEFTDMGYLNFIPEIAEPHPDPFNTYSAHYISDAAGELRRFALAGIELDVSTDPNNPILRTVAGAGFRMSGGTNDAGQVALSVGFTDNTRGIVLASYADGCLADVNGDGQATPTDFTAWLSAFNANAPECDQNGDGQCTPTDFSAWISNYTIGC